ncbi:MAG: DUF3472 domain-containing protein [Arenibacter latericius]|nr:DUF3472 domain-containing protein [Arenibacter latericius]
MKTGNYLNKLYLFFLIVNFSVLACSKEGNPATTQADESKEGGTSYQTENDSLFFTPNESFFSPTGTLKANLRDKSTGNIYNKYEYYDYITNWEVLTDTIVFGVDIKTPGKLIIKPEMGIPNNQDGSKIYIYLDDVRKEIRLASTGAVDNYKVQDHVTFDDVEVGFHVIKLQIKSLSESGMGVGDLTKLHLMGTAVKNANTVMRRYRANAVHCKWETESSEPVEISVHELTIQTKSLDFYQPITTPFGYTGSTWDKDTQTFGGFNFSLWSYGANEPAPPFDQESHLIAVGPGLEFGSYGHEGTGVKPRGDHPYVGIATNTQTIAVRKQPGVKYDTYWSYYLDPSDGHWKLYGAGKKYNKSGKLTGLETGAFVEVPGGAHKMRNGHETAETQYRGWQRDTSGNWHPINKMVGTTGPNTISYRDWRVVGNKFSMQMGGWGSPGIEKKTLSLSTPEPIPDYLKGTYIEELYKMPATFKDKAPIEISDHSATLRFNVSNLGTNASAYVFWGTKEGLTKEVMWQNSMPINIKTGENIITLNNLERNMKYYYRVKIQNEEGITWSFDTQVFKTVN